jgi:ketosteroid isomerase-like protein
MYKFATLCLMLALLGPVVSRAGAESDLETLEQDFNAAYAANQLERYFAFYTEDAVFFFPDGRTDLPRYRKQWSAFIKSGGAIKSSAMIDLQLKFSPLDDTAIASYLLRVTTREPNRRMHAEEYQETDVWFKSDAGWKITHVHYSPVVRAHKPAKKD